MRSWYSILMSVAAVTVVVHGQIPIPRREVGFVYGGGRPDAPIQLDFYGDLLCPDTEAAFPAMRQVADCYGPETLRLRTLLFPLPYHRNSFPATKVAHIINELSNGNKVYDWIELMLNNIGSFSGSATFSLSDAVVAQRLAKLAVELVPEITEDDFEKRLVGDGNAKLNAVIGWKYACTRGVAATPTFMLNDIQVPGAQQTWTLDQWRIIIDDLLDPEQRTCCLNPTDS